jgi:alpha-D-ribose 1-methylphosphonate 5-triphosphate synthase subunit PhnG
MMVQGRIGGTGEKFNLGEVTITRCALRIECEAYQGPVGVSYVLGRDHRQAELAAIADALLQDPSHFADLEQTLLRPVREHLKQALHDRQTRAQSTRVDFMTVAREAKVEKKKESV